MQESVDDNETQESTMDSNDDNLDQVRSPEIPGKDSKVIKNERVSDCEEDMDLAESPCSEPTSSKGKYSIIKEDSGFVDKISVSSSDGASSNSSPEGLDNKDQKCQYSSESSAKINLQNLILPDISFPKASPNTKQRNYRKRSLVDLEESNGDNPSTTSTELIDNEPVDENNLTNDDDTTFEENDDMDSLFDSDGSSDSDFEIDDNAKCKKESEKVVPLVLLKPKPKHNWNAITEVVNRPYGFIQTINKQIRRTWGPKEFQDRYYSSLHAVQRLELMYKLEAHESCVNSLGFDKTGSLLASGSDDLYIHIWNWSLGQKAMSFKSGHRSNVFQSKFLPFAGDIHVASSSRDGQVRLSILSPAGDLVSSRHLCQHRGMVNKISLVADQPHIILSAGDDGIVISTDIRDPVPNKIAKVRDGCDKVSLYSIHCHPVLGHEFVLGSKDHFIRIYDTRNTRVPQAKFKPASETKRLDKKPNRQPIHTTAVVYNFNGREILASYTDDNLYLFNNDPSTLHNISSTSKETERDYIGCYTGHRNQATIKSCNFFGPRSEYIVSGSDCSYCYIWEKKTESIVQWLRADENGVVNCMEPHPHIPILATSGLDSDVKIWIPSKEEPNAMDNLKNIVRQNKHKRFHFDPTQGRDYVEGQMLWMFLTHVENMQEGSSNSDSSDDDDLPRSGQMPCSPS